MTLPLGLVFDMDGTLLDTERLYVQATQEVIAPWGHTVTAEVYGDWVGRDVSPQEFLSAYPCDLEPEELRQQLRTAYQRLYEADLCTLPGAVAFLRGAAAPYPKAIASSSRMGLIESHLARLGLRECFSSLASGREVAHGKPAPDVFLLAATRLGVSPERCVVFEDSVHGIAGAKAAGMVAVAVPTEVTRHLDFSLADLVVDRLDEVGAQWLADLAARPAG